MSEPQARCLARHELDRWERLNAESPQGSLYSSSRYIECIEAATEYWVVEERDKIVGGFALTRNELGIRANPLFVKYLGVIYAADIADDLSAQTRVDQALLATIDGIGAWSYAFSPAFVDWTRFYGASFEQTTRYTYRIDFHARRDFRSGYGEKVRAPLRAANRHGVAIRDVSLEELLRVNRLTYSARGGKPPYSDERLTRLLENWRRTECLYMKCAADDAGQTHAVAAIVYDERDAHLLLNGSDPQLRRSGANTLLIDHMIEFASTRCRRFDFEGSMHPRIAAFYRGFGGTLTPYFQISRRNLATWGYHLLIRGAKALLGD